MSGRSAGGDSRARRGAGAVAIVGLHVQAHARGLGARPEIELQAAAGIAVRGRPAGLHAAHVRVDVVGAGGRELLVDAARPEPHPRERAFGALIRGRPDLYLGATLTRAAADPDVERTDVELPADELALRQRHGDRRGAGPGGALGT